MFTMMTVNTVNIVVQSITVQVALTVPTKSTDTGTETTSAYGAVLPTMATDVPIVPQRFMRSSRQ